MMKSSEFELFCQEMYRENCREREGYKDAVIPYEDYFKFNYLFLKERYTLEKVKETYDGSN